MKITLKNVKHYESMSEETDCFEASLYVDGKKVGRVSNRGTGGSNDYHLDDFSLEKKLDDWCKTNLPKWKMSDTFSDGDDEENDTNLEIYIGELLESYLKTKELKKHLAKSVLVVDDTCSKGEFFKWTFSKYKNRTKEEVINGVLGTFNKENSKYVNPIMLNTLSLEEALKIF